MKKIVSLVLAAALACGLLAGCGEPKDKTLCLPFGAFSSLDATEAEIVKAEHLIPYESSMSGETDYYIDLSKNVKINEDVISDSFLGFVDGRLGWAGIVCAVDNEKDWKPLYNRIKAHLESIYGESDGRWEVTTEQGYEYEISLSQDKPDDNLFYVTIIISGSIYY